MGVGAMRSKILTLVAAACSLGVAQAASAADLPAKMPVKAALAPVVAPYNWSGFYVGGNVGYGWGQAGSDVTLTTFVTTGFLTSGPAPVTISDSVKPKGIIGGAQIGYNWQPTPNWLFGLEADWQGSAQKASSTLPVQSYFIFLASGSVQAAYDARIDWFGTVRGRIGYTFDRFLLYATGGLAYGEVKIAGTVTDSGTFILGSFSSTAAFGASRVNAGWTVGGGIEGAFYGNWSVKAEYLYLDLGSLDASSPGPFGSEPVTAHTRFTDNIVRVGVNYRFGGGR